MTEPRTKLIAVMVEAGLPANEIDANLKAKGFEPLTDAEKTEHGITLPEDFTVEDLLNAGPAPTEAIPQEDDPAPVNTCGPEDGQVNHGQTLADNPVTGKPFTELNHHTVSICAAVSNILKKADPASWQQYKSMKQADPSEDGKRKAYRWAFGRLLEIGYAPTQEGG